MRHDFDKLQQRLRAAEHAYSEFQDELRAKYGAGWKAPVGKQKRLDAMRARADKASDAFFAWLDRCSPRQWRTGAPYFWIVEELTYDDAITAGPLSVVPPVPYGRYESDMVRFAAAA